VARPLGWDVADHLETRSSPLAEFDPYVVRGWKNIDPFRFLAGCRKRQLILALLVIYLILGIECVYCVLGLL